jgi:hypothetical protein
LQQACCKSKSEEHVELKMKYSNATQEQRKLEDVDMDGTEEVDVSMKEKQLQKKMMLLESRSSEEAQQLAARQSESIRGDSCSSVVARSLQPKRRM